MPSRRERPAEPRATAPAEGRDEPRRRTGRAADEERALLERFVARGDRQAFQTLVRPHIGPMRGLARRFTRCPSAADDLVQEALLRALRHLHGLQGGVESLRCWLFRIVVQLGADPQRWTRAERLATPGEDPLRIPAGLADDPSGLSIERELEDRLAEAMERLPARQRAAIHLRAREGLGYRAVGEAMGCSEGAARMLVLEARKRLLERLEEYLEP